MYVHMYIRTDETENKQLAAEGRNERFAGSDEIRIHYSLAHALLPTHLVEVHACLPAHLREGTKRFPSGAFSIHALRETLGARGGIVTISGFVHTCFRLRPISVRDETVIKLSLVHTHSFQHISTKRSCRWYNIKAASTVSLALDTLPLSGSFSRSGPRSFNMSSNADLNIDGTIMSTAGIRTLRKEPMVRQDTWSRSCMHFANPHDPWPLEFIFAIIWSQLDLEAFVRRAPASRRW